MVNEHASFAMIAKRVAEQHADLPSRYFSVLRLCDGVRDFDSICTEAPLPVTITAGILLRLVEMGLCVSGPSARAAKRTPPSVAVQRWVEGSASRSIARLPVTAFSPEEEAFFAAAVKYDQIEEGWDWSWDEELACA